MPLTTAGEVIRPADQHSLSMCRTPYEPVVTMCVSCCSTQSAHPNVCSREKEARRTAAPERRRPGGQARPEIDPPHHHHSTAHLWSLRQLETRGKGWKWWRSTPLRRRIWKRRVPNARKNSSVLLSCLLLVPFFVSFSLGEMG